ncbi:Cruciform DNA binding protein [Elasticomyces elasticus]|nr:Cruciform DNA binding protein [Elasticomyces elasticus]
MGSHLFKWEHPAQEVYVTGTFDNWSKSVKLDKKGDTFEKLVNLPSADAKILYKFVVDGDWTTDHTAPSENDHFGYVNNVLHTDQLDKRSAAPYAAMSSAAPESSTAKMAAAQPLEKSLSGASSDSFMPGQFPETPAKELSQFVGSGPVKDPVKEDVMPGKFPETLAKEDSQFAGSGSVKGDVPGGAPEMPAKEAKDPAVNPSPASEGSGNPTKLAPDEKLPNITDAQNKMKSTVYNDPELKSAFERGQADAHKDSAPSTEATGSSMLDQAKDKANQAYGSAATTASQAFGSVASAMGLGGKDTEGTTSTANNVGSAMGLGGKDTESTTSTANKSVTEQVKDATSQASTKVGESMKQASDSVGSAMGLGGKDTESATSTANKSVTEQAKDATSQASTKVGESVKQPSDSVRSATALDGKSEDSVPASTDKSLSEQAKSTYDQVSARATETANQASAQVKDTANKVYGNVASATGYGSKEPENEKSTGTTAAADTEQTYGVKPIPASGGTGNPIHLQPGEPIPETSPFFGQSVNNTVRHDKASYENSDHILPPALTPQGDAEAHGASIFGAGGMFGMPAASKNMIPESSLPMGGERGLNEGPGFLTQSAAPQSSTAQMAGHVPLERRGVPHVLDESSGPASGVPEVVSESQHAAHVEPEAAAFPEVVHEKSAVEQELMEKVHKEPPASESGTAAKVGGVLSGSMPPVLGLSSSPATGVPDVVSESQHAAHVDPEAAAFPEVVHEKSAVEQELMEKVHEEPPTSDSGAIAQRQGAMSKDVTRAVGESSGPASDVPEIVSESQHAAHVEPEAAAIPEVVHEKSAVEQELLDKVPEQPSTSESGTLGKSGGHIGGMVAGGAAAAGAAIAGGLYAARGKTTEKTGSDPASHIPPSVLSSIQNMNASTTSALGGFSPDDITTDITHTAILPPVVTDSHAKSGQPLEAAAFPNIVREKAAAEVQIDDDGLVLTNNSPTASMVPGVVADSVERGRRGPEAAANPEAVAEKSAVEAELLANVKPAKAAGEPAPTETAALSAVAPGAPVSKLEEPVSAISEKSPLSPNDLNAPAGSQAQSAATMLSAPSASKADDSRDVSPMSGARATQGQEQPMVTTGVASGKAPEKSTNIPTSPKPPTSNVPTSAKPATSSSSPAAAAAAVAPTPQKARPQSQMLNTPDSARTSTSAMSGSSKDEGKKKRRSFWGKLKDKLKE